MSEDEIINSLNLGTAVETLNNAPNSPLSQMLEALINDIITRLQQSLQDRNINTSTRNLSQSMKATAVELKGDVATIGLSMEFYWKFINFGVNGTEVSHGAPAYGSVPSSGKSFSESIREWIPARGLSLPPQFKNFDQFTFAIMTNIRKKGKEPRPFFEDVINAQTADVLRGPIERLVGRSITIAITSPWQ